MLIWLQASSSSGTMRHSYVETKIHRDVHITLLLLRQRRGDTYSPASVLLEEGTVDGGEWKTALGANKLGRDRGGRSFRRRLDRGAPTGGHIVGRSIWLTGSSGGLCCNRVQECFVGHEERHTNVHAGQGSGLSGKASERLLPCGWCGGFRWFSNYNAERIATDWCWERYGHWHDHPSRKRTWSGIRIKGSHLEILDVQHQPNPD